MKTLRNIFIVAAAMVFAACGSAKKDTVEISVMSYNIRQSAVDDGEHNWDIRKPGSVSLIQDYKPDLFGLQEAQPDQVEYMASNLPEYTSFGEGRFGNGEGEHMKIYFKTERFDLLESGDFWLSETPDSSSLGWDARYPRMVSWVKLHDKVSDKALWYFNTHLDHKGPIARENGVKFIVSQVQKMSGDDIYFITGDFNLVPEHDYMKPMFDNFLSARDEAPKTDRHGTANGWGKEPEGKIIDYIFYGGVQPVSYETILNGYGYQYVSDHYPIISVFEINK